MGLQKSNTRGGGNMVKSVCTARYLGLGNLVDWVLGSRKKIKD